MCATRTVLGLTAGASERMAATSLTAQPPRLNPSAIKSADQGGGVGLIRVQGARSETVS